MKPVVKAYKNDSELEVDVTALQDKGMVIRTFMYYP